MTTGTRTLYKNAYALMAATVLTSGLGMAYWALAAHLYSPEVVGRSSAVVAAMMLLSNASQLNLSVGLMRFLPVAGRRRARLVLTGYGSSFLVGLVLSVAFLAVVPDFVGELHFLDNAKNWGLLFAGGVAFWTVFALQDAVLTGLRAAVWVPLENTVFSLVKLGMLVLLAGSMAQAGILVAWVVPMVLTLVPVNLLIFRGVLPRVRRAEDAEPADAAAEAQPQSARSIMRFVGGDYVGTLFSHGSTTALPLLVISLAGARESAVFYVAWMISGGLDFIATGTASSFLVEASGRPGEVAGYRRLAARRAMLLLLPVSLSVAALAAPVLWVFGEEYGRARWAVVVLAVAAVPRLLLLLRLAYFRVLRRIATVVRLQALACLLMLGLTTTALHLGWGSTGVAGCWLVTETVALGAAALAERRIHARARALDQAAARQVSTAGPAVAESLEQGV